MSVGSRYDPKWQDALGLVPISVFICAIAFLLTKHIWFDPLTADNKALFWLNLTTALATIGLCVVGAMAAIIAWIQLSRFNDNERIKNTLELIRGFNATVSYRSIANGALQTTTVTSAVVDVAEVHRNINAYAALRASLFNNTASPSQHVEGERLFNSIAIVLNFFASAGMLHRRNLIDTDLFVETFGQIIGDVFDWGTSLSAIEHGRFDATLSDFKDLAKIEKSRRAGRA